MKLSFPIICISLVTVGIVMWFSSVAHFISYLIGLFTGGAFILLTIRKIGLKGKRSIVWDELFTKITKYKARIINIDNQKPDTSDTNISVKVFNSGDDEKDIIEALTKQLNLPMVLAREATSYVRKNFGQQNLEGKISEALKFIDQNQVR